MFRVLLLAASLQLFLSLFPFYKKPTSKTKGKYAPWLKNKQNEIKNVNFSFGLIHPPTRTIPL